MKLKEMKGTTLVRIIDNYTAQHLETLDFADAVEKYGECEIFGSYTEGFHNGGFKTSVWINIPGMKLCGFGNVRINIRWQTGDEATFRGKKSGQLITVTRYGNNDYSAWWHDSESSSETEGYSVRGTMWQIMDEMKGEF